MNLLDEQIDSLLRQYSLKEILDTLAKKCQEEADKRKGAFPEMWAIIGVEIQDVAENSDGIIREDD